MTNLAVVFFGIQPDFLCHQPALDRANWTFAQIQNLSSPLDPKNDDAADGCEIRRLDYDRLSKLPFAQAYEEATANANLSSLPRDKCDSHHSFDNTVDMEVTIVTQWDLVCGRKFLVEHSQMVYMAGFLVGSFSSGLISDRFGRKYPYIVSILLFAVLGVAQAFMPTYPAFLAVRFCMAFCNIASYMTSFCLCLEVCTNKWRVWIGGLFFIPYACGYTALALFAFLLRDWRTLHWVISLPCAACVIFIWLLDESPRWLLVKGRTVEAEAVLRKAARRNGVTLPEHIDMKGVAEAVAKEAAEEAAKRVSLIEVFKYRVLSLRAVNIFFNWFVNSMVYYGVSLNVSQFDGDRFMNNAIAGAVEVPAIAICVPLLFWGRKRSLALTLLAAGISLLITGFLPAHLSGLKTAVAMIGKFMITASFSIIYVITLELYPTPVDITSSISCSKKNYMTYEVRNSGVATSSCVARVGSIIAPYISGISKLGARYRWAPVIVFGGLSVAAGLLTLFLPETKGKKLPDTFHEAINLVPEKKEPDEIEMS